MGNYKESNFEKCIKFENEFREKHNEKTPLYIFGLPYEGYFTEMHINDQNIMSITFIDKKYKEKVKTYDLNRGYEITIRLGIDWNGGGLNTMKSEKN